MMNLFEILSHGAKLLITFVKLNHLFFKSRIPHFM